MKTLILPLVFAFSLMANAQFSSNNSRTVPSSITAQVSNEITFENLPTTYADSSEETVEFPFDVNAYLPANFDPYKGMIIDESYALITEEVDFAFEVEDYLPEGFDPYEGMIYVAEVSPEEIPFNFNIEDYLPAGFNPNQTVSKRTM